MSKRIGKPLVERMQKKDAQRLVDTLEPILRSRGAGFILDIMGALARKDMQIYRQHAASGRSTEALCALHERLAQTLEEQSGHLDDCRDALNEVTARAFHDRSVLDRALNDIPADVAKEFRNAFNQGTTVVFDDDERDPKNSH
jgi:hypothetical protein